MVLNLVLSTENGNRMVKHLIILMTMLIFLIMLICSSTRALSAITGNGIATLQLQHICSPWEYSPHLLQEYFQERYDQILDNFTLSKIWSKKLYLPFFGVWLFNCSFCWWKQLFSNYIEIVKGRILNMKVVDDWRSSSRLNGRSVHLARISIQYQFSHHRSKALRIMWNSMYIIQQKEEQIVSHFSLQDFLGRGGAGGVPGEWLAYIRLPQRIRAHPPKPN